MLDQFLTWFDFTIGSDTYNLLKTPWQYFVTNISVIQSLLSGSGTPADYDYITHNIVGMVTLSLGFVAFVIFLAWVFCKIFSYIARSFTGWMSLK